LANTLIAVGGFSSEVGKTTLVCELLKALPGCEAIKLTRGHYRSCAKDPHCCRVWCRVLMKLAPTQPPSDFCSSHLR
jgi:hypothetical protein